MTTPQMKKRRVRRQWGAWRFRGDTFILRGPQGYEFDFDRCKTSAGILDQVVQISTKGPVLFSDRAFRNLLNAIDDVLAPQANYCSLGKSKRANPRTVARRRGYKDVLAQKPRYSWRPVY